MSGLQAITLQQQCQALMPAVGSPFERLAEQAVRERPVGFPASRWRKSLGATCSRGATLRAPSGAPRAEHAATTA